MAAFSASLAAFSELVNANVVLAARARQSSTNEGEVVHSKGLLSWSKFRVRLGPRRNCKADIFHNLMIWLTSAEIRGMSGSLVPLLAELHRRPKTGRGPSLRGGISETEFHEHCPAGQARLFLITTASGRTHSTPVESGSQVPTGRLREARIDSPSRSY